MNTLELFREFFTKHHDRCLTTKRSLDLAYLELVKVLQSRFRLQICDAVREADIAKKNFMEEKQNVKKAS